MDQKPLVLDAVVKSFGERYVLRGLDVEIPGGAVVGLLGRNGEGKTTLLKTALGLIKPELGEARVFGHDAWTLDASIKERIGYVPQVISLYPWMRVGQMADYTAAFYRKWNTKLVDNLLRDWGLDPRQKV